MPDPYLSPSTVAATAYTIHNSNNAIVELRLPLEIGESKSFSVRYPNAAAAMQVELKKTDGIPSAPLALLPGPVNTTLGGRTVIAGTTSAGADDTLLSCTISFDGSATDNWEVRISGLAGGLCEFGQAENNTSETITRIMSDPVASFTITPVTLPGPSVKESTAVTLTASPATGPPLQPTVVKIVAAPLPTASYSWTSTGGVAISALPACGNSQNQVFTAPGVYGNTIISLTLKAWFDSPCPTIGFLNTTNVQPLTITPRTQHLMIVLDRTGSMWGQKWDNAKAAVRMLLQLFASLRSGVSTDDRVGLLAFEDHQCTWHMAPRDAGIQTLLALGTPATADSQACPLDMGAPGDCTPIGDALIAAMESLNGLSIADEPRFTIILATDGMENSGTVRVDVNTTAPGYVQNFSTAKSTYPNVNNRMRLFTVGIGQDTEVSSQVLAALAAQGQGMFRLIQSPDDIESGIAQMMTLGELETQVVTPAAGPTSADPSPPATPCRYFTLNAMEHRLCIIVKRPDPPGAGDTLTISRRDQFDAGTNTFQGQFTDVTPVGGVRQCPTHLFATIDLAALYGGDAGNVPKTEWRVTRSSGGAVVDGEIMVFVDLYAKAEVRFDKTTYGTGDTMVVTARVRAGGEPIRGARVTVELARPGESLGTFLSGYVPQYGSIAVPTHFAGTASSSGGDPPGAKAAIYQLLLRQRDWEHLPVLTPPSIFTDGTNRLFDDGAHQDGLPDDGNYANIFQGLDKEGTYTWRFTCEATLPDGSPFRRQVTLSQYVGITFDPLNSDLIFQRDARAPSGWSAIQVIILPRDAKGELLGPFQAADIVFSATTGRFCTAEELGTVTDGIVFTASDGAAIISHYDGRYSRKLLYQSGEVPILNVAVQGRPFPPVPVGSGCLGTLFRLVYEVMRRLVRLILRH